MCVDAVRLRLDWCCEAWLKHSYGLNRTSVKSDMAEGYCWACTALFITPRWVCLCVCVFTYSSILQRNLCTQRIKRGDRRRDFMETHLSLELWTQFKMYICATLFRCDVYFFSWQGQWWHCGENGNEVCVHWCFVSMCRGMCMLYNTRTVLQRRAACWLSEVEERASVLAEPLSNNKSFT